VLEKQRSHFSLPRNSRPFSQCRSPPPPIIVGPSCCDYPSFAFPLRPLFFITRACARLKTSCKQDAQSGSPLPSFILASQFSFPSLRRLFPSLLRTQSWTPTFNRLPALLPLLVQATQQVSLYTSLMTLKRDCATILDSLSFPFTSMVTFKEMV